MLDGDIEAFLQAATNGSFSQAARALYLTPNAVKKRVQALEGRTGVRLFSRNNRGLTLTPAGALLRDDLTAVARQMERAVGAARALQDQDGRTIWLGVSGTFVEEFLSSRWPGVDEVAGRASVRVVGYGRSAGDRAEMLGDVGEKIDACVDLYEPRLVQEHDLCASEISRFRLCLATPGTGRAEGPVELATISLPTIALLPRGLSRAFDETRDALARERPDIELEDLDDYGIQSLDRLRGRGCGVIAPESVAELYPHLGFAPLAGAARVCFGVYTRRGAGAVTRDFVRALERTRNFR